MLALALLALPLAALPARAVMDINDRGPVLKAGNFVMRITNIGVVGNAFFDRGFSFDPSFEYPKGSGQECLNHAELWVGAVDASGHTRVSGGPMLEWRPTLDPNDRVLTGWGASTGAAAPTTTTARWRVSARLVWLPKRLGDARSTAGATSES